VKPEVHNSSRDERMTEKESECYVVKTALRTTQPWLKEEIEKLVQLRSRVESFEIDRQKNSL
jgi:hypothetical protein